MKSVTSTDGTVIAYEQQGSGPALILVDGALSTRGGKAALRALLVPQLTVFGYDRRGRGDSGDTLPYVVDREIEDIQALIEVAGGTAALYGHSSGAVLALDAALQLGGSVTKIALYEVPCNDDPAAPGISVEVDDVDAVHARAIEQGLDIVYALCDEEWGVRRFMLREPSGTVVNVLSHRSG